MKTKTITSSRRSRIIRLQYLLLQRLPLLCNQRWHPQETLQWKIMEAQTIQVSKASTTTTRRQKRSSLNPKRQRIPNQLLSKSKLRLQSRRHPNPLRRRPHLQRKLRKRMRAVPRKKHLGLAVPQVVHRVAVVAKMMSQVPPNQLDRRRRSVFTRKNRRESMSF